MKFILKILFLIIIDFIIIKKWLSSYDLNPSVSITLIILIPKVIMINIIIGLPFLFLKKKGIWKLLLINAIIASILTHEIFTDIIHQNLKQSSEHWKFMVADTIFDIHWWEEEDNFSISYSVNSGSSTQFIFGTISEKENIWILRSDSLKMEIIGNKLVGFREDTDTIPLRKIY